MLNSSRKPIVNQSQKGKNIQVTNKIQEPNLHLSISLLAKIKGLSKNALQFSLRKQGGISSLTITAEEKEVLMKKYGNTTRSLCSGNYFGEKALLNNDCRSATIVVDTHLTEMITLEKKYFKEFLSQLLEVVNQRKHAIINIFPEMAEYSQQKLDNMLYCFQPQNFTKGMHLCFQSTREDKLFIIQEGEVQLEKNIRVVDIGSDKNQKSESNIQQDEQIQSNDTPLKKKTKVITIKVSIISSGGVIGEEMFLGDDSKYEYTCTVLSPTAIILVGDKKSIDVKFSNNLKNIFLNMWENKEKIRREIIKNRTIEAQKLAKAKNNLQLHKINIDKHQQYLHQQNSPHKIESYQNIPIDTTTFQSNNRNTQLANKNSQFANGQSQQDKNQQMFFPEDELDIFQVKKPKGIISLQTAINSVNSPTNQIKSNLQKSNSVNLMKPQKNNASSVPFEPLLPSFDFGSSTSAQIAFRKKQLLMMTRKIGEKPKVPLENIDQSKKFENIIHNSYLDVLQGIDQDMIIETDQQIPSCAHIDKFNKTSFVSPQPQCLDSFLKNQEVDSKRRNKVERKTSILLRGFSNLKISSQKEIQGDQNLPSLKEINQSKQFEVNNSNRSIFCYSPLTIETNKANNLKEKDQLRVLTDKRTSVTNLIQKSSHLISPVAKSQMFSTQQSTFRNHTQMNTLQFKTGNESSYFQKDFLLGKSKKDSQEIIEDNFPKEQIPSIKTNHGKSSSDMLKVILNSNQKSIQRKNTSSSITQHLDLENNQQDEFKFEETHRQQQQSQQQQTQSSQQQQPQFQLQLLKQQYKKSIKPFSQSYCLNTPTTSPLPFDLAIHQSTFIRQEKKMFSNVIAESQIQPNNNNNNDINNFYNTGNNSNGMNNFTNSNKFCQNQQNDTSFFETIPTEKQLAFQKLSPHLTIDIIENNFQSKRLTPKIAVSISQLPSFHSNIQQKRNPLSSVKSSFNSFRFHTEQQNNNSLNNAKNNKISNQNLVHSVFPLSEEVQFSENQATIQQKPLIQSHNQQQKEQLKKIDEIINKQHIQQNSLNSAQDPFRLISYIPPHFKVPAQPNISQFCYLVSDINMSNPFSKTQYSTFSQSPNITLHNKRLKQFKEKQISLGGRKTKNQTSKSVESPQFEMMINQHKESFSPKMN